MEDMDINNLLKCLEKLIEQMNTTEEQFQTALFGKQVLTSLDGAGKLVSAPAAG